MTKTEKWVHAFPEVLDARHLNGFLPMRPGQHPSIEIISRAMFWSNLIFIQFMGTLSVLRDL